MGVRQLLIGVAIISVAAGVATWGIRTFQMPGQEAVVVMTGLRSEDGRVGAHANRNRQVVLINNLELSDLESTNTYGITSMRARQPGGGTLLRLTVSSDSRTNAINGANAVAVELVENPLGANSDSQPLDIVALATSAQPTSVPVQEAVAVAAVVLVLGVAFVMVTSSQEP